MKSAIDQVQLPGSKEKPETLTVLCLSTSVSSVFSPPPLHSLWKCFELFLFHASQGRIQDFAMGGAKRLRVTSLPFWGVALGIMKRAFVALILLAFGSV